MAEGRGGFWNRAGRRSGGNRPTRVYVGMGKPEAARYQCPSCSNDLLPVMVTAGCADCRKIVELHNAGKLQ